MKRFSMISIVMLLIATSCQPDVPTASTFTSVPPTASSLPPTPTSKPTATQIPSPTPLPGSVVYPIDTLGKNNPWLPYDDSAMPAVNFVAFNYNKPPFNSAQVRKAFAYAIDREVLFEMITKYKTSTNPRLATSITPPEILGRDLYGEVGIEFNPEMAKEMLVEAGYPDTATFPKVIFLVNSGGEIAPGARFNLATAMAKMWMEHLGIVVEVQVIGSFGTYLERINNNPPDIFWTGWTADYNDPDNFLRELFYTDSENNNTKFSNPDFDALIDTARYGNDPAERQRQYIQAEQILCEEEVAIIPIYHSTYQ